MWLTRRKKADTSSHDALKDAQENLQRAQDREPAVEAVAYQLRILRERNHFTEKLRPIMLRSGRSD